MEKVEVIARRIMGWKLQRLNKWYNIEKNIVVEDFHPEHNIDQAMQIVKRLKEHGFSYIVEDDLEVHFKNDFFEVCETGDTLAQAITNAAYSVAENNPIPSEWL